MRIAVVSDIHGNFRALQAVLDDIKRNRVDEIISLGDNIGYGPEPEEVVQALKDHGVMSIMGNHELGLVSNSYYKRLNPMPQQSLDLTRDLMSRNNIAWSAALPDIMIRHSARFVHGSPPGSLTVYIVQPSQARLKRLFASYPETICFFGHTHYLIAYELEPSGDINTYDLEPGIFPLAAQRRYLINPGSVGQPRDEINRRAKYGIWDLSAATIEVRAVAYDAKATKNLILERGFPEMNAWRL